MGIFQFIRSSRFSHELIIEPPAPDPDRDGIAIVACIENEISYIVEWVRFHQSVGVKHFILYDDVSTDGTFTLLKRILSADELTVIPWSMRSTYGGGHQELNSRVIAFAHAIENFGARYRRMAFIDVDEFLLPKTGMTLEEALAPSGDCPNISLPWHMFGHSDHDVRPQMPVTMAYTKRVANPMAKHKLAMNFRYIVDPCQVTLVAEHHVHTKDWGKASGNDAGLRVKNEDRKRAEFYSASNIQLNRYYSKSHAEFKRRLEKPALSVADAEKHRDKARDIEAYIERKTVEDRSMIEFIDRFGIELD